MRPSLLLPPRERFLRAPSVVDGAGGATYVRPFFSANRNAVDQTGIAIGTPTQVLFTTKEVDEGGYYDTSSSFWTPPIGKYLIGASLGLDSAGMSDQALIVLYLFKGGSTVRNLNYYTSGTNAPSFEISAPVVANGSDFFSVFVTINGGVGTKTVKGDVDRTYFWGVPID